MSISHATYSPEDNKIRMYPASRLDQPTYERVKAAGFQWAPKQECFYAPMWTPSREDIAEELSGEELGDEDTSLVERAEQRAERFGGYRENRKKDADRAHDAVAAISSHIPFGQPILVGHHSERHARRDAQRIEDGMRKAVKMWETAEYWKDRAAGALSHAKYKELPNVRARRIKTIEADKRKAEKSKKQDEGYLEFFSDPRLTRELALFFLGRSACSLRLRVGTEGDTSESAADCRWVSAYDALKREGDPYYTEGREKELSEVVEAAQRVYPKYIAHYERWIQHYENRLMYEKAMLGQAGFEVETKKQKSPSSLLPICNYRAESIVVESRFRRGEDETLTQIEMTSAEYAKVYSDDKGTQVCEKSHRVRMLCKVRGGVFTKYCVFLTDSKEHKKPEPQEKMPTVERVGLLRKVGEPAQPSVGRAGGPIDVEEIDEEETETTEPGGEGRGNEVSSEEEDDGSRFHALKDSLRAGVKVVSANQLFPTPPLICGRMVALAGLKPGYRVLEPSAGTGNILRAVPPHLGRVAVEINYDLCKGLRVEFDRAEVIHSDFLDCMPQELGLFDAVLMNPPFENASDIHHIIHALEFLKPGGVLVAICAGGPRQETRLKPLSTHWERLPSGTFDHTGVCSVLLTIEKPQMVAPQEEEPDVVEPLMRGPREYALQVTKPMIRQRTIFDETGELPPMRGGTIHNEAGLGGLFG